MDELKKNVAKLPIIKIDIFNKRKKDVKLMTFKYKCEICGYKAPSGQALGGHISRRHTNTSENFLVRKKKRIERTPKRELNEHIKKTFWEMKKIYNYDQLIATKEGKEKLKNDLRDKYGRDFRNFKKAFKRKLNKS
jgi:hypothetical protein